MGGPDRSEAGAETVLANQPNTLAPTASERRAVVNGASVNPYVAALVNAVRNLSERDRELFDTLLAGDA